MKLCTLVVVTLAVILTLDVLGTCEGWWGSSRSSSSKSSSGSSSSTKTDRGKTVKVKGNTVNVGKGGIRERDETGHRTGLGTLAKKMGTQSKKTIAAGKEFVKSYQKMRKANKKGGNLPAHEEANREAIFIDMFAPKWPRALHKLAPFALGGSRNTLGY
ncbi:hypothetical protein ACROYT_G013128 [Oculina patagonica]